MKKKKFIPKPLYSVQGRCKTHPKYKVKRPPTADCPRCQELWLRAFGIHTCAE